MGRRCSRGPRTGRRSDGSSVSITPVVYGLAEYDTSTRLATGGGQGLLGAILGHWVRLLFWPTSVTGASVSRLFASNQTASGGWRVVSSGTNTSLTYGCLFTGPTLISTTAIVLTSSHLNKLIDLLFVWDQPAGLMRVYYQGVEISTTVVATAYILPVAERTMQGSTSTPSSPCTDNVISAFEGGDGFIPTAGEVAAAHAETRARVAANLAPFAGISGKTTHRWQSGNAWNPPTLLTDGVGSHNLTIVTGSAANLVLGSLTNPAWAA